MIPVFAVIPEGERPQTTWGETGGDDAVCFDSHDDEMTYVMGFESGEERCLCSGPRHGVSSDTDPDEWFHWGSYSTVDEIEGDDTLENAIRHVAEE